MENSITRTEKNNIDIIKSYIESYILQSRDITNCEYEQTQDTENNNYFKAKLMLNDYNLTVIYKTFSTFKGEIGIKICFPNCEYKFSIYDIFNLQKINNYNIYDFTDCIEKKRIEKVMGKIAYLIDTYSSDISSCNNSSNISKLIALRKTVFGANTIVVYTDDGFLFNYISLIIISSICMSAFLILSIGRTFVVHILSGEEKELAKAKFYSGDKTINKIFKILTPIILLTLSIVLVFSTESAIGFNNKQLVFNQDEKVCLNYEDVKLYNVENPYPTTIIENESDLYNFIIVCENKYYEVPTMNKSSYNTKQFLKALKKTQYQGRIRISKKRYS